MEEADTPPTSQTPSQLWSSKLDDVETTTKPDLRLDEKIAYTVVLGFLTSQPDLEQYLIYYLLIHLQGCAGGSYIHSLGIITIVSAISGLVTAPAAGALVDRLEYKQHWVLRGSAGALAGASLITYGFMDISAMLAGKSAVLFTLAVMMVVVRQQIAVVNRFSGWKALKMRGQKLLGAEALLAQDTLVSRIGTLADLFSDAYELLFLSLTWCIAIWTPQQLRFAASKWVLYLLFFSGDFASLVLSFLIKREDIVLVRSHTLRESVFATSELEDMGGLEESDAIDSGRQQSGKESFEREDHTLSLSFEEEDVHEADQVTYKTRVYAIAASTREILLDFWEYGKESFIHLWNNKVALHSGIHFVLMYVIYMLASSPLSIIQATKGNSFGKPSDLCNHFLSNILLVGMLTNVLYFIGALVYLVFFVKLPPTTFFRLAFPVISGVLVCLTLLIPFFDQATIVSFTIVSVLTPTTWYLVKYDYYLCTSAVEERYYGFLSGTGGVVVTVCIMGGGLLLSLLETDTFVWPLAIVVILLLGVSVVHSYYIVCNFSSLLQESHKH